MKKMIFIFIKFLFILIMAPLLAALIIPGFYIFIAGIVFALLTIFIFIPTTIMFLTYDIALKNVINSKSNLMKFSLVEKIQSIIEAKEPK